MAATDAIAQTIDDARTIANKIHGRRAKAVKSSTTEATTTGEEPVKTSSTSQQSFDKLLDHFTQLVTRVASEPSYTPNEEELKVATLQTFIADLRTKEIGAVSAHSTLSNARITRDRLLYGEVTGVADVAQAVKQYIKSLFGPSSPELKQLSKLKFK